MNKPTFLMNVGTAWSATSPLHYTLSLDHKYAHTGACKENFYLYNLQENRNIPYRRDKPNEKPSETVDKHDWEILWGIRSLDTYVKYYVSLWEHVKNDYKAVADFCNRNTGLTDKFLSDIKEKVGEHFDIKITMIFRDPIRRLFSSLNHNPWVDNEEIAKLKDPIKCIRYCVQGNMEENVYYSEIYRKFCSVFGKDKVHMIVMEELWSDDRKVKDLSDFLDFPITTLHDNAYFPERGTKAFQYRFLRDQWASDKVEMDQETYSYCLEHMDHVYSDFAKTFGRIPITWGEYIPTPS